MYDLHETVLFINDTFHSILISLDLILNQWELFVHIVLHNYHFS